MKIKLLAAALALSFCLSACGREDKAVSSVSTAGNGNIRAADSAADEDSPDESLTAAGPAVRDADALSRSASSSPKASESPSVSAALGGHGETSATEPAAPASETDAAQEAAQPAVTLSPADGMAVRSAADKFMSSLLAGDFEAARELTAAESPARQDMDGKLAGSLQSLMGDEMYAQIKALTNFAGVDISTDGNSARLKNYVVRLADYSTFSLGEANREGGYARINITLTLPDLGVGRILSSVETYLASIGTDIDAVRAEAADLAPEEKSKFMEELAWGFADYSFGGGLDLTVTADLGLTATLEKRGQTWLVADLGYAPNNESEPERGGARLPSENE